MTPMAQLPMQEVVRLDSQRLCDILAELGEEEARSMIAASAEQISAGLASLGTALAAGQMAQLAQIADRLARLAWQIGMVTLSSVAVDAADCAGRGDHAATGAVVARLRRVGARSLAALHER